jgi:hypothetical protein
MTRATAAGQVAHTGGARSEDGRAAPGRENGREAPPRAAHEVSGTGLAKSAKLAKPAQMRAGLLRTSLRFLTWVCVGLLSLLSLLPGQDMVRTGFPGPLEHFAAYAGSGAIAMAGYGLNRGAVRVIGCLWVYAAIPISWSAEPSAADRATAPAGRYRVNLTQWLQYGQAGMG